MLIFIIKPEERGLTSILQSGFVDNGLLSAIVWSEKRSLEEEVHFRGPMQSSCYTAYLNNVLANCLCCGACYFGRPSKLN